MLPVGGSAPPDFRWWERPQGRSNAVVGASFEGHQKGTVWCTYTHTPPNYTGDIDEDAGELTAPECGEFDPGQHLSYADIAVDNRSDPKVVSIRIKQSKTDPFRQGVTIFLGRTDGMLCPVAALMSYLAVRGPG